MIVPKFLGRDCELSTTGLDPAGRPLSSWEVTRRILDHAGAAFAPAAGGAFAQGGRGSALSSDCLRRWLPNGQCLYSDMGHVEACTAEVLSPHALAVQSRAVLRVAERARAAAERAAAPGTRLFLSTANVDALDPGISWGTHLSVSIAPELFEELFVETRRPAVLGAVATAVATATAFFGCGYLLPLAAGGVAFSTSGRAHHLTRLVSLPTTVPFARGLLNSRREGLAADTERLHLIALDFTLLAAAPLASFLQCALAAAEIGRTRGQLFDPLQAVAAWSTGLDRERLRFPTRLRRVDGRRRTLDEEVEELASGWLDLVERGRIPAEVVPGATEGLGRAIELARALRAGERETLARGLDWAAKLAFLEALERDEGLDLASPRARMLDHDFVATDPARGPLWGLLAAGLVDDDVGEDEVEAALAAGPRGSRAAVRGTLIAALGRRVVAVDWDRVEISLERDPLGPRLVVDLDRPNSAPPPRRSALDPTALAEAARDVPGRLRALLERALPGSTRWSDPRGDLARQVAIPDALPPRDQGAGYR